MRFGDNACWSDEDSGFFPLIDVSTWLQLLSRGDFMYIPDILTVQRDHPKKASYSDKMHLEWAIDYYVFIQRAWNFKTFLKTREQVIQAINKIFAKHANRSLKKNLSGDRFELLKQMIQATKIFINGSNDLPKFKF